LRRIIIIGTALAVLTTAGVALAASLNSYGSTLFFSPSKAGSASRPSPVGFHVRYTVASTVAGERAAPVTHIRFSIYGLVSDGKDFPKCTASQITANHTLWDTACPKGSLVAEGPVNAVLGPANDPSSNGSPCNPYLHIYNAGQNKMVEFLVEFGPYQCAGLRTGSAQPYVRNVSRSGGYLVMDVPLPADVSTQAGGLRGVYSAQVQVNEQFVKQTKRVNGRTVASIASIGCRNGRRPWKISFTAQNYPSRGGNAQTNTVAGSSKC
jgi:hypothetical protein